MSTPPPTPCSPWLDTPARYGRISRILHWLTASLVIAQFIVIISWGLLGKTALTMQLAQIAPHGAVGLMLLVVIVIRSLWRFHQRHQRPASEKRFTGQAARAVHHLFYGLLILIPGLALLRHYGRNRAFEFYSIELIPSSGREISWLMTPADLLHGVMAWLLLALVIGHIAMVGVHQWLWKDKTLDKMTGALTPKASGTQRPPSI